MGDAGALHELLAGGEALTIVCHNNPDPDCLASAIALGRIAAHAGIDERRIVYSGEITHQQNRAFINLLSVTIHPFDSETIRDRPDDHLIAFVDHSTPGENNRVPDGTAVDIVIDHHPAEEIEARYVDHRESIGATATILTQYLLELEIEIGTPLATALVFAIRRETLEFLRGVTAAEYAAAAELHDRADSDLLRKLSTPSVSGATIDSIADAIRNRTVRGSVLITHVERASERDALPQAADYLATLEGVETAIVFGIIERTIHISARTTDSRVHIGETLNGAFDDVGSAGGHQDMAGGEIPLGIFADVADDEDEPIDAVVARIVTRRLVTEMNLPDETGNRSGR